MKRYLRRKRDLKNWRRGFGRRETVKFGAKKALEAASVGEDRYRRYDKLYKIDDVGDDNKSNLGSREHKKN